MSVLRKNFPDSLDALQLAQRTRLPQKTIYAQLGELRRARLVRSFHRSKESRGRPAQYKQKRTPRWRYVIHNSDLSPANCAIDPNFLEALEKVIDPADMAPVIQSHIVLLHNVLRRMKESNSEAVKKWIPGLGSSCTACGENHDVLAYCSTFFLYLIQKVLRHHSFYGFLHDEGVLDLDEFLDKAYEDYK